MLCYSWDSREYLNDQWEPHVFVVGVMYRSMRYEYIAGHHISYICLWMAAHRKKDDWSILFFIFMMLKPSLRMTDRPNCCSDFFFLTCSISFTCHETSMTLSLSCLLFYVQSVGSAIGFGWPEELAMVLSAMLSLFSHSPSFTPCPCEVLCSHAPWYISCATVQFTDNIFSMFWPVY